MTEMQNKALYIRDRCLEAGMTLAGVAGALINMECESLISEINVEDRYHSTGGTDAGYTRMVDTNPGYDFAKDNGKHYGYGLMQWTLPSRKTELRQYCRARGVSIGDFKTQVEFFLMELKRDFPAVWKICCGSNSCYNCAWQICRWYENPDNAEGQAAYRGSRASEWYDWLQANGSLKSTITKSGTQGISNVHDSGKDAGTAATPQPASAVNHSLKLRVTDEHCAGWPEASLVQALLICRGYKLHVVDGSWDDEDIDTLKQFQAEHGLEPDGVAGKKTWAALGIDRNLIS